MTENTPARPHLAVWGLASLHSVLFVFPVVVLLYSGGSLGSTLGGGDDGPGATLIGLGLYAALWASSWLGTWVALVHVVSNIDFKRLGSVLGASIVGGAVSGGAFWVIGAVSIGILSFIGAVQDGVRLNDLLNGTGAFIALATLGSVIASAFGAAVGIGIGVVEYLLFRVAMVLIESPPRSPRREAAAQ